MGERLLCTQEVIGSIPFTSTMGTSHPECLAKPEQRVAAVAAMRVLIEG